VNTEDGPTKLVRQDAILCGLSIGQAGEPNVKPVALNSHEQQQTT